MLYHVCLSPPLHVFSVFTSRMCIYAKVIRKAGN
jgi:hypothetical protein